MYPENRVLVGIINRKRDLVYAQQSHWYRIPRERAPRFIETEYYAFFLSSAFGAKNGGIHYYARRTGHELVRRRDLLPNEKQRADELYYKVSLEPLIEKIPPILNPTARPISFIFTTYDRFMGAKTIADLYSKADLYVERVMHALEHQGIRPERRWEDEGLTNQIAELRIRCKEVLVIATTEPDVQFGTDSSHRNIALDRALQGSDEQGVENITAAIQSAIAAFGGAVMLDIP